MKTWSFLLEPKTTLSYLAYFIESHNLYKPFSFLTWPYLSDPHFRIWHLFCSLFHTFSLVQSDFRCKWIRPLLKFLFFCIKIKLHVSSVLLKWLLSVNLGLRRPKCSKDIFVRLHQRLLMVHLKITEKDFQLMQYIRKVYAYCLHLKFLLFGLCTLQAEEIFRKIQWLIRVVIQRVLWVCQKIEDVK